MNIDFDALVDRYIAAWNETDADRRLAAVSELWAQDGGYTDPLADVTGPAAVAELIGAVQQQFPGLEFRPGRAVDGHHNTARFGWELAPAGDADAEPVVVGFDVAVTGPDGRLRQVYGFLDRVPAGA
ncbi:nuclear transport factor 2 family protein [Allostreptomyces psammosilenae]|uniref:SnoaL-like domain-containing protein n=1 Tax=Allostreptomyces psammosilenae TaxID=1892865 RepID=A0A853A0D1_9ACTN|nr:nuclear transport factor 2 family protein [Allostreptomyces psammosilenae]NYI08036.1 hypothetical protein [Allostreptomyces psammosilenae]